MKFHLREKLAVESVQHLGNGCSKFVLKLFLGIVFRRIGIQRKPIRHHRRAVGQLTDRNGKVTGSIVALKVKFNGIAALPKDGI